MLLCALVSITVAELGKLYCLKLNPLETFETIPMTTESSLEGLHSPSATGSELCTATCRDQVGCVDLTWFKRQTANAETSTIASTGAQQSQQTKHSSPQVIEKTTSLTVEAHENNIAFMVLNHSCTLLATASIQVSLFLRCELFVIL